MKKKSILYLLLGAVLISGCGSKKQDMDYQKDLRDNKIETSTVSDVSKTTAEDSAEVTDGEEVGRSADVSYVIEGNNTITVNADIARKGNVKFAQAKASTKVYTEEDIKKIADNFFDNATYITLLHPSQGTGAYVKERTTKLDEYEHSLIGEDGDSVYGFVTGTDDEEVDFITNEEYLVVAVTPSGVDSVVNINQMEVDEIVNSDVEIMSFEEINKIAQEKMNSKELDTGYNQDIELVK